MEVEILLNFLAIQLLRAQVCETNIFIHYLVYCL